MFKAGDKIMYMGGGLSRFTLGKVYDVQHFAGDIYYVFSDTNSPINPNQPTFKRNFALYQGKARIVRNLPDWF